MKKLLSILLVLSMLLMGAAMAEPNADDGDQRRLPAL